MISCFITRVCILQTRSRSGTLLLVQGAGSGLTQHWFVLAAVVELQPLISIFSPKNQYLYHCLRKRV